MWGIFPKNGDRPRKSGKPIKFGKLQSLLAQSLQLISSIGILDDPLLALFEDLPDSLCPIHLFSDHFAYRRTPLCFPFIGLLVHKKILNQGGKVNIIVTRFVYSKVRFVQAKWSHLFESRFQPAFYQHFLSKSSNTPFSQKHFILDIVEDFKIPR